MLYAVVAYSIGILFLISALLDGISTSSSAVSSELGNGGFEEGSSSWILPAQAQIDSVPSDAHSGSGSLRLIATQPWQPTSQRVVLTPGQPYDLVAWGRSTTAGGLVTIVSHDASGAELGPHFDRPFAGTGTWVMVSGVYVPPAQAVSANVLLQSAAPGTFWFDDVSLKPGNNLLNDGNFEAGATDWMLSTQTVVDRAAGDAHSGSYSIKLTATGPWQGTAQNVTVLPGHRYHISGWGRSKSSGGAITLIGLDANGLPAGSHFDGWFKGTGTWDLVTGLYVAPANAVSVNVVLQSSGSGTYWFDDVVFAPTNQVVEDGGFEQGAMGWILGPQSVVDSSPVNAHSGTASLELVALTPWNGAHQSVLIDEGKQYVVSGWERSTTDGGHLTIVSFGADGREIGSHFDLLFHGSGGWVHLSGTYRAPSGTVRIDLYLQSANPGLFWFDDISMTQQ